MRSNRIFEHDFEPDERPLRPRAAPSRPDAPARAKATGLPRIVTKSRLLAFCSMLGGGIIVANAVWMQKERHPAPMFKPVTRQAEAFPMPPVRPEAYAKNAAFDSRPMAGLKPGQASPAPSAAPAPRGAQASAAPPAMPAPEAPTEALISELQRELGKRGYFKGEPTGKLGALTTQAIRDFQFAQRVAVDGKASEELLRDVQAVKVTMKDELLDLVKRSGPDEKQARTVLDVQRALNKAGYGPVSEDGQIGPATRNALARFEQDRKLPPRGEPKGPVLRALASASGLTISQ